MATACWFHKPVFVPCLMVFLLAAGCSGRKITTGVEDQTFLPGPSPPPVIESTRAEPAAAEIQKPPTVTTPVDGELVTEKQISIPAERESPPPAQPIRELADIFFDFDRFAIRRDAQLVLEGDAAILKVKPFDPVVIEGHCDERGTSAYNLVLGERRAQAASRYLQDLGVAASQIQIISYGEERPFCVEHSEACWQSNRRAHFRRP